MLLAWFAANRQVPGGMFSQSFHAGPNSDGAHDQKHGIHTHPVIGFVRAKN